MKKISRRQSLRTIAGLAGLLLFPEIAESKIQERLSPQRLYEIIKEIGNSSEILDEHYLVAIAQTESSLNPLAKSRAGARGLFQLTKYAWEEIDAKRKYLENVFNPEINTENGSRYLAFLEEFCMNQNPSWDDLNSEKQKELILAAYNLGPYRLKSLGWNLEKTPAVKKYVERIKSISTQLRENEID